MPLKTVWCLVGALVIPAVFVLPSGAFGATASNPLCPGEEVLFNPGNGEGIVVPDGFAVSVFAKGLNFPTGIAFRGHSQKFEVCVLESGAFPASRRNNGTAWQASGLPGNPFTPNVLVFDQSAKLLRTLGKPADASPERPMPSALAGWSISASNKDWREDVYSRPTMRRTADASLPSTQ